MSDTPTDATTDTSASADVESVDQLPEWARTRLTKANAEAAKYRTEKNTAVTAAKAEVTAQFEAQLAEAGTAHEATKAELLASSAELLKLKAALAAEVPSTSAVEFASLLQGTTQEEIAAHAEKVKALFGGAATTTRTPAVDLSPSGDNPLALNGDPLLQSLKDKLGI